jgi:hypothetical protein
LGTLPCYANSLSFLENFQVSGTLTEVGNPVCGGSPCQQVIQFTTILSVLIDDQGQFPTHGIYLQVAGPPNTSIVTSNGALGSSFFASSFQNLIPLTTGAYGWLPFFGGGQEIDVFFGTSFSAGGALSLLPSYAETYQCVTATCRSDFAGPYQGHRINGYAPVDLQTTITPVSEAGTSSLLFITIFAVIGYVTLNKRRLRSVRSPR